MFKKANTIIYQGKAIIDPEDVEVANNHGALICHTYKKCSATYLPEYAWQLSHYRDEVMTPEENITMHDETALKFKDALVKAVQETIEATGFKVNP